MDESKEKIIEHLEMLNAQVRKQNSIGRMFVSGIVYGIGFFIGSAILATIALGVFGPRLGQIGWIRNAYELGASLRTPTGQYVEEAAPQEAP